MEDRSDPIEAAKSKLFDTSSWGEFCDVTLTLKQGHQPDSGGWVKIEDYRCRQERLTLPNSADRSEQRPAQPGEREAERPNVSAAEFGILGDDPVARCGRPDPVKPTSASIAPTGAPSSPRSENHEKGIGDGGRLPQRGPGGSFC